jgi:hypothetical protein
MHKTRLRGTYQTFPEEESKMKKRILLSFRLAVLSMLMAACAPAPLGAPARSAA